MEQLPMDIPPPLPPAPHTSALPPPPMEEEKRDWSKVPLKALEVIPRVTVEKLRQARFENLEDIRREFIDNHGRTLMAIPTFGRKTVSEIKKIVFSA